MSSVSKVAGALLTRIIALGIDNLGVPRDAVRGSIHDVDQHAELLFDPPRTSSRAAACGPRQND